MFCEDTWRRVRRLARAEAKRMANLAVVPAATEERYTAALIALYWTKLFQE